MKQDCQNMPIFVTGIERSGTSIVARILRMCGAFTGETTEMQENVNIKILVDNLYKSMGANPNGQQPMPNVEKLYIPIEWKRDVFTQLENHGYTDGKLWMYKSSRICQIWPVWYYAFPNARWIIVRRRTGDIIQSCLKTKFMTAFNDKEGWRWWVHEHEKRFVEMMEAGLNCKVIWPERMVTGDYQQIYEMLEWVGLKWNPKVVEEIDPLLVKSRR
jgi:hypothetical protein